MFNINSLVERPDDNSVYRQLPGKENHLNSLIELFSQHNQYEINPNEFLMIKGKWSEMLQHIPDALYTIIKHNREVVGVVVGVEEISVIRKPLSIYLSIIAFTVKDDHKRAIPLLMNAIDMHLLTRPYIDYVKFTIEAECDTLNFDKRGYTHHSTSFIKSREEFIEHGR